MLSAWTPPVGIKEGIVADDAKDSKVESLVQMFVGVIAVHPQLIGVDPVVPVDGASTLVICYNYLWLVYLYYDLV